MEQLDFKVLIAEIESILGQHNATTRFVFLPRSKKPLEQELQDIVASVYLTYSGVELYPTLTSKAANLFFSVVTGHPFMDGNKRMGLVMLNWFLGEHNLSLELEAEQQGQLTISTIQASGRGREIAVAALERVLTEHCRAIGRTS